MKLILLTFWALIAHRRVSGVTVTPVGLPTIFGNVVYWDVDKSSLYYTDSIGGNVYRYDAATNKTNALFIGTGLVAFFSVQNSTNQYVVVVNFTVEAVEWDGQSTGTTSRNTLFTVTDDRTHYRFGEAKTDTNGVLFVSSQGNISLDSSGIEVFQPNLASLYRYQNVDGACSVYVVLSPISNADGLAWSPDNSLMYLIDFVDKTIYVFDYALESAELSNKRVFFNLTANGFRDTPLHAVFPSSIAIDTDGNLWVPVYGIGIVLQISSEAEIISTVDLPTSLPDSAAFGGSGLQTLYITTIQDTLKPETTRDQPAAGYLLEITDLGVTGHNGGGYPVNICCDEATVHS